MSRARILADYVSSGDELADKAPLASPEFTGTVTATGGLETDTNSKIKQKGAFMQSSTHQSLTLGY